MDLKNLDIMAAKIRRSVLDGVYSAASGHPGGSLGIADVLSYLYFHKMNVDPKNPSDPRRDRFVLSKGHCAPALYAALALKEFFPISEIKNLRQIDSYLQGHPDMKGTPGVDMSTGSLGQGVCAANGMALSAKIDGLDYMTYTILGDGELEEGQVWEAAMFAAHYKLGNVVYFIDFNGLQIDGDIEKVMSPLPIDEKFKAFGFNVSVIDGNDIEAIDKAVSAVDKTGSKPTAIILKTIKGKGVSFMENQAGWHGNAPNEEQYNTAIAELDAQINKLEGGNQ